MSEAKDGCVHRVLRGGAAEQRGKGEEQTSNLWGTEEFLRLGHPLPNQVIVVNGDTLSVDLDGMRDKHWGNGSISPQCTKGVFIAERATFMRGR